MKLKELLPLIRDGEFDLLKGHVGEDFRTVQLVIMIALINLPRKNWSPKSKTLAFLKSGYKQVSRKLVAS